MSFTSNMSTIATTMFSLPDKPPNNAKNYICPRCNKFYDFQMATGNSFVGRIPLILNCKHTLCQDCVYKMYPSKDIICGECHTSNFLTDVEFKEKADQVFSVNYYILGVLTYHKKYASESSFNQKPGGYKALNLKPSGYKFKQNEHGFVSKPQSFLNFNTSQSRRNPVNAFDFKIEEPQQVCSQCKKEAKVNCSDCDEIFCKPCSDTLHNSAKGLKKHKVTTISPDCVLELTDTCSVHVNSLIEFCCETCQQNCCCYCLLDDHNGHSYHQFTAMNDEKKDQLKNLIENAEEVLKKMLISEKRIKNQVNKISRPSHDASVELTISKRVENAIAKLQILEKELLTEAHKYNNLDRNDLIKLLESLLPNVRKINNLISVGKETLDKKSPSKKLNIELLKKQLEAISNTPCYFLENCQQKDHPFEFSFDDSLVDDIQDSTKLRYTKSNTYALVTKDELPEDYVEQDIEIDSSPTSLVGSTSSLKDVGKPNEVTKPKRSPKYNNIEKWIRSNDKFPQIARELELLEMPILQKGDKESVTVSHLSSPDSFYVQLNRLTPALNKLVKSIDRHVKSTAATPVLVPEINSLYLVKYLYERQVHWCRARLVEEMEDKNMFLTFFIDYGNTSTVRKEDIMNIPAELKKSPPFAIECKFFDLYPPQNEWDRKALLTMTRIIANNELLMIVIEREANKLAVDLINLECLTSVRDALKFLGYGIPYCKYPTELDKYKKELKKAEPLKLYSKSGKFKKEDSVDVIICYVIDPYNIYVYLKNAKDHLINLHKKMDKFYKQNKKGFIYAPQEDMVVAVLYSDGRFSSWRRGIITKTTEGRGMVTVKLVDVGMLITVPWEHIRKLDPVFVPVDCQAILVKMTDIVPRNEEKLWSQNAIDYFTKFIKSQTVLKMVISEITEPPEVVFFECFPSVHYCLNAILVKDALAESVGDLSITVEWPQVEHEKEKLPESFTISMMKTIQTTTTRQGATTIDEVDSDDDDCNMFRKSIEIISAENPDLIYFRFTEFKERLHEFQLEMRHFYSNTKLVRGDWKVGDVCVVYYKKQYYRAIIQELLEDNKYSVFLNDIAQTVVVKEKQVGVLDSKFMKETEFALRCHLADITPAGGTKKWSGMACEYLQDIFQKHNKLYLAKKGPVDKERKSFSAVIWYVEFLPGGALESSKTVLHSINKLLLKNGLALKLVTAKLPKENDVKVNKKDEDVKVEDILGNDDSVSVQSINTETEDHECSSSISSSSLACARPPIGIKIDWNDLIEMQKQCPDQIIQDWISPMPFKANEIFAIPTFVNDDGDIFLHDADLEPLIKQMEDKMFTYLESKQEEVQENWSPGEMCSVRYHGNKKWYRGKILTVNGPNMKVVMVDYGNEEDCVAKDLSKEILYYDLPLFANRVTLDGVYPKSNKWLTSDLDILHAQLVEKTVHVTLKSQQILGLSTPAEIKLGDLDINNFILEHSTNLSKIKRPKTNVKQSTCPTISINGASESVLESSDCDVIIEDTSSNEENENEIKYFDIDNNFLIYEQRPLPEIKPDEKIKIAVINILNYNKIVFELPSHGFLENQDKFESLAKEINSSISELQKLESFEIGTPCIAKYPDDKQWYRAQIVKEVDENSIFVWFVDFGNIESVEKETVKEVKEEWLHFPVEHHIATIHGISLTNEKHFDKVIADMTSYYLSVQMAQVVSKDPITMKLYKEDSDQLSYQNLIDLGYLKILEEENVNDEEGTS